MIYIAFHFLKNKKWLRRHNYNSSVRAYINPLYEKEDTVSTPFLNITSGTMRVSSIFILGILPPDMSS